MKVRILSLRKNTDRHIAALEAEYTKRLRPFMTVSLEDIRQTYASGEDTARVLNQEAVKLQKKIGEGKHFIVLSDKGHSRTSKEFSVWLENQKTQGSAELIFVIGGPYGLDPVLISRAADSLSLSPLTLTHEHARLILLEQLYRASDIARGGRYHK